MLKIASFTFFALCTLCSVRGKILGAAGQDCTPDDDDLPELCSRQGQVITHTSKIECEENFDCCLCGKLRCAPNCDSFKANGDSAAYYVPNIIIVGNGDDGAEIDCDGDSSCEGAIITGSNIKNIKCGGDRSCLRSTITAECLDPCKLECDGDVSCKYSNIELSNVEGVSCDYKACFGATLVLTDVDDDFKLECGADKSCKGASITIVTNANTGSKIKSIECGGYRACRGATITIINTGTARLIVEELKCSASEACRNANIIVEGNVVVNDCECTTDACAGLQTTGFTCTNAPSYTGP